MACRFRFIILVLLLGANLLRAQYDFTSVLPGLDGQNLLDQLQDDFKPNAVLPYDIARDTMFRRVYGIDNTLSCVYTSYTVPMPLGQDPTQVVFMGGAANGINTEHSWPRSYGAELGNPKSDMHHLFPTRVDVNSDRGVLPFLEIPDNQTDSWYYQNSELSNIPSSNIDLYAERSGSAFEPPEKMKGNIARAIMYFKTIYASQSNQAPSDFFSSMQETLCQWHSQDPVDSLEWHRTFEIAKYQSGKPNPFVLDCTLPSRAFCPQFQTDCDPGVSNIYSAPELSFEIYPNPSKGDLTIQIGSIPSSSIQIAVYNGMGQTIFLDQLLNETFAQRINLELNLVPGLYWLRLESGKQVSTQRIIIQ